MSRVFLRNGKTYLGVATCEAFHGALQEDGEVVDGDLLMQLRAHAGLDLDRWRHKDRDGVLDCYLACFRDILNEFASLDAHIWSTPSFVGLELWIPEDLVMQEGDRFSALMDRVIWEFCPMVRFPH